ncbi:MAG: TatD family hydrolase [Bacteroidales bacterium]|nr:TatD family hydrolase [Bacteroidales bacterium]
MIRSEVPFIDIHTHQQRWNCFGIHPWRLDDAWRHCEAFGRSNPLIEKLESLLKENKIIAIGETGLDRNHKETIDLQLEVFEKHILLSEQYQKPLIIHNVKATADILRLHKKHRPRQTWIIHGFNGTDQEVRQLTERGICLSVGESIFYPNRKITKSISSIPLNQLFLETDVSERSIQEIYGKASELLNLPLKDLKETIFANFTRLILSTWNTGEIKLDYSMADFIDHKDRVAIRVVDT